MITDLRLVNFRRHENTELRFSPNDQVVLVSGGNGAGKSTLFEAATFALYGESRHGRRRLDSLLRRGAEFEGMEVELTFTMGATTYRVLRRRDSKTSTAVLFANDIALVEGAGAVTAEVTKIFGMDSAGFRLAVLAQQKELDALTALQPARRAEAVARLLRLDAISAAKDQARSKFRLSREVTRSLAGGPDVAAADAEVRDAAERLAGLEAARAESADAVAKLRKQMDATAEVEAAHAAAVAEQSRLSGVVQAADAEVARVTTQLAALVVPDEPAPAGDLDELLETERRIERDIAAAEQLAQRVADRATRSRELASLDAELDQVHADLDALGSPEALTAAGEEAAARLVSLTAERTAGDSRLRELRDRSSRVASELERSRRLADTNDALSSMCETCGQPVSDEHRHDRATSLAETIEALAAEADGIDAEIAEVTAAVTALDAEVSEVTTRQRTLAGALERSSSLTARAADVARRRGVVAQIIERLPSDGVDVDALFAERADAAVAVAAARAAADAAAARTTALARHADLTQTLAEATAARDAAVEALAAAAPSQELVAAFTHRGSLATELAAESEMEASLGTEVAVAEARLAAATAAAAVAADHEQRRATHSYAAEVAHACTELLADVSDRMAARVGPALSATISDMVALLSDGRFDTARVDADYEVTVRDDDGKFHPLADFSGGEVDLIALAVRLALASTVADRASSGGPGFLILDECFGSQDPARRQSILTALRGLRAHYGQIFLISHVGGLDESADLVVDLSTSPDRTELEVSVS